MKYFKKIGLRTGYDVFNWISLILMSAIYILPFIFVKNYKTPFAILSAALLLIAIVIRNQRAGGIGTIAFITLIQLVLGVLGIVILIVKLVLELTGKAPKADYAAQCWAGERRYDDDRAREYGYKSVDDAIEAGVMFDGTKLW